VSRLYLSPTFANACNSVILDSRLGFEMKVGDPITCAFAAKEQMKNWPLLKRPRSAESIPIPLELDELEESGNIGVHMEDYDDS
jgi:hypothetical protein